MVAGVLGVMNKRRKLIVALGAGAFATPLAVFAQPQGKFWRVGFLTPRRRPDSLDSDIFGAFRQGLRELGYVESKNLMIEWRFAEEIYERLPDIASDLVKLNVDVIVASGAAAISAAQKATTTIPVVMGNSSDPVGNGFIKSLARPGGNITGLSNVGSDLSPKLLEILLSVTPKLSRVAILVNPNNPGHIVALKNVQAAAQRAGIAILSLEARTPQEIEKAFFTITKERAGAIIVANDAFFNQQRHRIAELAAKNRLPSISARREYVEAGGLVNYGTNIADNFRRAATYVDKILKGAKPADLPVEQPTKFELIINGKTAKAVGLTIPQSLLISADKVIE